jgi:hypothetical protein
MKNLTQIKKEVTGYYGDGRGNFYILYKDGSRVLAKNKRNKRKSLKI